MARVVRARGGVGQRVGRAQADRLDESEAVAGKRSRTLITRLADTERDLAEAEGALRSLRERQDGLTGATMVARVSKALDAIQETPEGRSAAEVNLSLRRVFMRATFYGGWVSQPPDKRTRAERPKVWRWQAIEFEWKHGGDCVVPLIHGFSTEPGRGWRWQDKEEDDE